MLVWALLVRGALLAMDYLILDENHISIGVNEVEVQVIIFVEIFTYVIDDLVQVKLLPIVMVVVLIIIKV